MRTPAKFLLAFALVAAGIVACSGRDVAPVPAIPGAFGVPASDAAAAAPDDAMPAPDVAGCPSAKAQPRWIFLGACRSLVVVRKGRTLMLPLYKGYSVRFSFPRNDAARGSRVLLVDATGVKDIRLHAGKAFPRNGAAFLYLQTVHRGRPIVFAKGSSVRLAIGSAQDFAASQCGVAVLSGARDDAADSDAALVWKRLPVTAAPSGRTLVFSIPSAAYRAVPRGAEYVSITCTPSTTPTPSSSPSSSPTPTSSPLAAYCSNYTVPATATVPLNITDDSGLGGILVVYVTNGASFLDDTGNFDDATANPYPAACFSTTAGSKGKQALRLPTGISAGRIYFAYATPVPGKPNVVPNPLSGVSVSGPGFGYGVSPFPYDKIEYGLTSGATIDTTQVDALGLPFELSVTTALPSQSVHASEAARRPHSIPAPCATSAPSIVGVTSCNFGKIFQAMEASAPYNQLVLTQPFNGKTVDMQIVSPSNGSGMDFQQNLFALSSYAPATSSACTGVTLTYGYLSCVMNAYQTTSRLYSSSEVEGVSGTSGDNYCASSDGASNFVFTDVGPATACASATPNPSVPAFDMPVQEFTYGRPPSSSGCTQNILFGLPWGNAYVGASSLFGTPDAFAMWKALGVDLNRGVALSQSTHPVGGASPAMSDFFIDPLQNQYVYLMHYYFNANLAYALSFDDSGSFESGVTWHSGDPINLRINAVPTASSVVPNASPSPLPVPSPCAALPLNVGG